MSVCVYNKQTVNWIQLHSRQNNWLNGNWIHVYVVDEWSVLVLLVVAACVLVCESQRWKYTHTQCTHSTPWHFFDFIWTDHVMVCTENENQTNKQSLCYRNRFLTWLTHVRTKSTVHTSLWCASSQSSKLRHFTLSAEHYTSDGGLLHNVCLFVCYVYFIRCDTIRYDIIVPYSAHYSAFCYRISFISDIPILRNCFPFRNAIRNTIHNVCTMCTQFGDPCAKIKSIDLSRIFAIIIFNVLAYIFR